MSTVLPEHALYCFDVMAASLEGTRAPTPAFAGDEELCVSPLRTAPLTPLARCS